METVPTSNRSQTPGVRLVAWNIQQGGDRRAEAIQQRLRMWQPDICLLLEYRNTYPSERIRNALYDAGLTNYVETINYGTNPEYNGLLVAARWPLTVLDASLDGAPPHRWLLVQVAHPLLLTLGCAHVPHRSERPGHKYRYLAALTRCAQTWPHGPGIILGGFQAGCQGRDEETPYFDAAEDGFMQEMAAQGWTDSFRHLHADQRRSSWWRRIHGRLVGLRGDHAFVDAELLPHLVACDLLSDDAGWPSDHAALVLDLAGTAAG